MLFSLLIQRVKAFVIDWALLLVTMFVLGYFLAQFNEDLTILRTFLFLLLLFFYEPLMITFSGATLGQHTIGFLMIRNNDLKGRVPFISSFVRFIVKILLGWLSFITISASEKREDYMIWFPIRLW